MRRADGDEPRDLRPAVATEVGAHHQAAHAVRDHDQPPRAGRREDRVDLLRRLLGEEFDRRERRAVGQRVDRADALALRPARKCVPDAGVAEHAVHEQHRKLGAGRGRIGHQHAIEDHARRVARDRHELVPEQAQRAGGPEPNLSRPIGAERPGQREPDEHDQERHREVDERQREDVRQQRSAVADPTAHPRPVEQEDHAIRQRQHHRGPHARDVTRPMPALAPLLWARALDPCLDRVDGGEQALRVQANPASLVLADAPRIAGHQGGPRLCRELRLVREHEVPVQHGDRTRQRAGALRGIVAAACAVVAHAFHVLTRGRVRLAGEPPAIGVERHAGGVRPLDPVHGIDVGSEVPVADRLRTQFREEREVARDHQPLDVVRVAMGKRLADRLAHAVHAGLAGPVPRRQRPLVTEVVRLGKPGHVAPVDAADELAPAEHLPHEPLRGRERRHPRPIGSFRSGQHVPRVEQLEVHRGREQRMPAERHARPHRVLEAAELRQPLAHEGVERAAGIVRRHRPVEARQRTGVAGEVKFDVGKRIARDPVRCEHGPCRHLPGTLGTEALAVLGIVVPAAARGVVAVHQHARTPPHPPVEVLHPQRAAVAGPAPEVLARAEEVRVGNDLERNTGLPANPLQHREHAPVARLDAAHPGRTARRDLAAPGVPERGMRVRADREIGERNAVAAQVLRVVPHRREEERDARLVAPDVRRLFRRLDRQHRVLRPVEPREHRARAVQLVAKDERQRSGASRGRHRAAGQ